MLIENALLVGSNGPGVEEFVLNDWWIMLVKVSTALRNPAFWEIFRGGGKSGPRSGQSEVVVRSRETTKRNRIIKEAIAVI